MSGALVILIIFAVTVMFFGPLLKAVLGGTEKVATSLLNTGVESALHLEDLATVNIMESKLDLTQRANNVLEISNKANLKPISQVKAELAALRGESK